VVSKIFDPLQRYIRRRVPASEVDDILADALLTLWRRLDDVPVDDPLPWSYGVARRTMANHRRAGERRLRLLDRLLQDANLGHELQPSFDPEGDIDDERLAVAFASMGPSDQEVLRLWAWEALEPRDIATALGLTANAATIRLSRARRKLGDAMTRQVVASTGQRPVKHEEGSDG
jgi:RNA polymerase sigma-70 factor, ECF subfamily